MRHALGVIGSRLGCFVEFLLGAALAPLALIGAALLALVGYYDC